MRGAKRLFSGELPPCWVWRLQKRRGFSGIYWSNEPCWKPAPVPAAALLVVAVTGAGGTGPERRGQQGNLLQHRVTESLMLGMDTGGGNKMKLSLTSGPSQIFPHEVGNNLQKGRGKYSYWCKPDCVHLGLLLPVPRLGMTASTRGVHKRQSALCRMV